MMAWKAKETDQCSIWMKMKTNQPKKNDRMTNEMKDMNNLGRVHVSGYGLLSRRK